MTLKTCKKCKLEREESDFHKRRDSLLGRRNECKYCIRSYHKNYRKFTDPRITKSDNLKSRYGISLDDYEIMLKTQSYMCAIRRQPENDDNCFCVDHCHKTGRVRGILCGLCNRGIGHMQDSYAILDRASRYLRKAYE